MTDSICETGKRRDSDSNGKKEGERDGQTGRGGGTWEPRNLKGEM